ncbi:hypothetical protein JCM1841_005537 [Sporobolomyces salmonicolor]
MAPIIWGFDLSELSFHAFSSREMFDPRWHLRRERFVAYQLAMLICLAAECTATYSLDKYEDLQTHIQERWAAEGAHVYQNDIIDMQIVLIVMCVMVACLYGADFFFLLQFPRRRYPKWYQSTKKACAIIITLGVFAAALGSTIVVARNSAKIEHVSDAVAAAAAAYYFRPPLQYNKWAVNIAYVVLVWIGWVAVVISTILMFMAADYDALNGTEPSPYPSKSLISSADPSASLAPLNRAESDRAAFAAQGGNLPEAEKVQLPVPEGRHAVVRPILADGYPPRVAGLDLETDHATFEGEGRQDPLVTGPHRV